MKEAEEFHNVASEPPSSEVKRITPPPSSRTSTLRIVLCIWQWPLNVSRFSVGEETKVCIIQLLIAAFGSVLCVLTEAVNDLVICRLSKQAGTVKGGEEVFLLCEKVNKGQYLVLSPTATTQFKSYSSVSMCWSPVKGQSSFWRRSSFC